MKANPAPGKVKNPVFPSAKPKVLTGAEATTVGVVTTVLAGVAKVLTGACAIWWTGAVATGVVTTVLAGVAMVWTGAIWWWTGAATNLEVAGVKGARAMTVWV